MVKALSDRLAEVRGLIGFLKIDIHFIIPFGKFGPRYLGKAAAAARAALVLQVHAGSFPVSVIHRTLTWTTGSVSCVRDHSYVCVNTRGLGHTDGESAHF